MRLANEGNHKEAVMIYSKGIELYPRYHLFFSGRALEYMFLSDIRSAISDMNEAIRLDPSNASYYAYRGGFYDRIGQPDQALKDLNKAIELNPNTPHSYQSRANHYRIKGMLDLADKDNKKAVDLYFKEGRSYMEKGEYKFAINSFTQVIHINAHIATAYFFRADAQMRLGQYEQAVNDFKEGLKYQPREPDVVRASYNLACIYALQKDEKAACQWLNLSVEKGFKDWDQLEKDKDFDPIRGSACFKNILSSRGIKENKPFAEDKVRENPIEQIVSPPAKVQIDPAQTFTSPTIKAKFVLIPSGAFVMGSPYTEPGREDGEDQRKVSIDTPFYMQTMEVTQEQWEKVIRRNASRFKAWFGNGPVERVTRDDIEEFIVKLNAEELTDKYRLPTEAEWEYAARAGSITAFYTGSCLSTEQANYDGQSPPPLCPKGKYRKTTTSVGSFPPNAWGLYDMLGNVWELVQDHGVARGGSWDVPAKMCRSASRLSVKPDDSMETIGFRLVRTAD